MAMRKAKNLVSLKHRTTYSKTVLCIFKQSRRTSYENKEQKDKELLVRQYIKLWKVQKLHTSAVKQYKNMFALKQSSLEAHQNVKYALHFTYTFKYT